MSTSPTGSSKDNSTDFFRQLSQQKEVSPPPIPHQSRVKAGLIMGALLGLVYGLISQLLNALLLAGVPLALYPFGLVGNLIASIVVWSIVGGVCAAPDNSPLGIILGSLTMAGAVTLWTWLVVPPAGDIFNRAFMNAGYVAIFIVAVLLGVPLMLLVRWAVDLQGELALKPWWSWRRLRAPIAAIALLGVATSILTLYSEDMRESMIMLNTLIKRVGAAARVEDVPVALEGNGVSDFFANAARDYTLERSFSMDLGRVILSSPDIAYSLGTLLDPNTGTLSKSKIDSYREIVANPAIVARFANGWVLACLVSPPDDLMLCKSNPQLP